MANYYVFGDDPKNKVWEVSGSPAATQRIKRKFPSRFGSSLPGFSSGDPRVQGFLRDAADALDDNIDQTVVNYLASDSGVAGSFSRMRTACGVLGSPAGHVLHDNTKKLQMELNLSTRDPTDDELGLLHQLLDFMCKYAKYSDLKVAAKSSQGLPKMSFERDVKLADAMRLLEPVNLDEFFRATERRDGERILRNSGVAYIYLQNYRASADVWGKVRKTPDLDYAVSGGSNGKLVEVDKTVYDFNGHPVDSIQANRPRLVMGMNNPINIVLSSWSSSVANYYLKEFSFTWKHTSSAEICDDLNSYLIEYPEAEPVGVDVGQFDASVYRSRRMAVFNHLRGRFYSEQFANMVDWSAFAAVLQPETGDGLGAVMHGDWRGNDLLFSPGILSGHAFVSFEGKVHNIWQILCCLMYAFGKEFIFGKVDLFLKGALPVRTKNMGDDGILLFPNASMRDKFFSADVMSRSFLDIKPEDALVFGGDVFYKSSGKFVACKNMISFCTSTFCNERPWDSKLRQFWNVGLAERPHVYGQAPSYHDVVNILDKTWKRRLSHLGATWSSYSEYLIERNRYNIPGMVSEADKLFVMNPDAIHYKIDIEDVSKELIDENFSSVPLDHYSHMIGTHLLSEPLPEHYSFN